MLLRQNNSDLATRNTKTQSPKLTPFTAFDDAHYFFSGTVELTSGIPSCDVCLNPFRASFVPLLSELSTATALI
jgi:hypothetical protein